MRLATTRRRNRSEVRGVGRRHVGVGLLLFGSIFLGVVQTIGLWLVARQRRSGWLLTAAVGPPWAAFNVATGQYGFLVLGVASFIVSVRAFRRWSEA